MDPKTLETEAQSAIAAATGPDELEQARVRYLGRKSELKQALREVRDRETGMELNALRERLEAAFAEREGALSTAELERILGEESADVTLPGEPARRGHYHLLTQIRREVEDIFLGLGYEVVDGDVYMVSLGRVYRRDTIGPTNFPIFHQVEGLAVAEGITVADLKGTLLYLCRALFGEDQQVRFITDFFPFTEPSLGVAVSCFLCGGEGCRTCKFTGWIELAGSGFVDPNVLRNVGYDPEEVSGFAFGMGLERIAMLRHGVPDIRLFWENDLRFLAQF